MGLCTSEKRSAKLIMTEAKRPLPPDYCSGTNPQSLGATDSMAVTPMARLGPGDLLGGRWCCAGQMHGWKI